MDFQLRHKGWGLFATVVWFVTYWTLIIIRAATDEVSFTKVAWQHPMLWMLGAGAAIYFVIYGASYWSTRGTIRRDERDTEIGRRADAAGSGFTALGGVAALVMLASGMDAFWVAHTVFAASFLGTLASVGLTVSAYTEGLDR